jgi:hypothetical protein
MQIVNEPTERSDYLNIKNFNKKMSSGAVEVTQFTPLNKDLKVLNSDRSPPIR